jgi:hypothetical protein
MPNTALAKTIEEADEALKREAENKEEKVEGADTEVEEKPEVELEEEKEKEEESESEEEDLDEPSKDEAFRLYKALKDPKAAPAIIAALAQQVGVFPQGPESKGEERQKVKDIKLILADSLGPEYKFLADRLGPAIEAVITQEREAQAQQLSQIQLKNIEKEIEQSFSSLSKETKGESRRLEARMYALMDEIVPSANISVDKYIRHIYAIASAGRKQPTTKEVADKIRRNANDAPSRLQSGTALGREGSLPNKKMNINQSINWALDQLSKEHK